MQPDDPGTVPPNVPPRDLSDRELRDHVAANARLDDGPAAPADPWEKELAERRVERTRERAAATTRRQPVRLAVLDLLRTGPATPSEIARQIGSAAPTVTRALAALRAEGLVTSEQDPHDGRLHPYRLEHLPNHVAAELGELRTFGPPVSPPAPPSADEDVALLADAVRAAVGVRRSSSAFADAAARLRAVVRESRRRNVTDLELAATRELLTTLRWAGEDSAFHDLLASLHAFAVGAREDEAAGSALPAYGHLEYELGRSPGVEPAVRRRHLETAASVFTGLHPTTASHFDDWGLRAGWSYVSLADLHRGQSQLGHAFGALAEAERFFRDADDPYGLTRTVFLRGFCLRLQGRFREALEALQDAHRLAVGHRFPRFAADSLMQLGETHRCLADHGRAMDELTRARADASQLGMEVTVAFAESALGALAFESGEPGAAHNHFATAHGHFRARKHDEGLALNARRHAIALRTLGATRAAAHVALTAEDLLEDALRRYTRLRSPAGVTACLIEGGWLRKQQDADPRPACNAILRHLDRSPSRELLEQDPWVPAMLLMFAEEAGHEELLEQSKHLVRQARHWQDTEAVDDYDLWASEDLVGALGGGRTDDRVLPDVAAEFAPDAETWRTDGMASEPLRLAAFV